MTIEETTTKIDLIQIHADRVIKELEAIPSEDAVRAIAFANTVRGRAELHEMCETALPYEQICDQLIWSGNLDRNDPAAAGERAAREDNARVVSDAELADELTALSVDELLTLWSMANKDLSTMHDRLDLDLDAAGEHYKEILSVYRRLEIRIEFLQNHKET